MHHIYSTLQIHDSPSLYATPILYIPCDAPLLHFHPSYNQLQHLSSQVVRVVLIVMAHSATTASFHAAVYLQLLPLPLPLLLPPLLIQALTTAQQHLNKRTLTMCTRCNSSCAAV
jgi:hypothetical protein